MRPKLFRIFHYLSEEYQTRFVRIDVKHGDQETHGIACAYIDDELIAWEGDARSWCEHFRKVGSLKHVRVALTS